jgi:FMN phosphatase YigB (HAD superfamily)
MARDLDSITHLTFDVGGTVFDWHHGIKDEVTALASAQGVEVDAAQFANDWRREMFVGLGQVRSGELPMQNGLSWDSIMSCEFLGHYKPDAEAYLAGLKLLGTTPEQTMMVAAHPGDLRASAVAGLATAYVPRPGERGEGNDGDLSPQADFDVNASDFPDLATQFGV